MKEDIMSSKQQSSEMLQKKLDQLQADHKSYLESLAKQQARKDAESAKVVADMQSTLETLKARAKSNTLGSAVLLRNKKNEELFTLHGNINVNRELWNAIGRDLDNSPTDEAQLDFSMNQSKYLKHDRLDPTGVFTAPAFWVEESSDFVVETYSQHVQRDPNSAYDMFALPGDRDTSVGVRESKQA